VGDGSDSPERVDGLIGTVVRAVWQRRQECSRCSWLETEKSRLVLRRKEGPTFDDRSFHKYVGKRAVYDGFIVGYMMLVERIEILPEKQAPT
jgi:hypothetical protein